MHNGFAMPPHYASLLPVRIAKLISRGFPSAFLFVQRTIEEQEESSSKLILSMCNVQSVSSKYSIDRARYILQEESSSKLILSMWNVQSVSSKYSIDRARYILQEESSSKLILSMCNVQSVSSKYSIDRARYILQEESSS